MIFSNPKICSFPFSGTCTKIKLVLKFGLYNKQGFVTNLGFEFGNSDLNIISPYKLYI